MALARSHRACGPAIAAAALAFAALGGSRALADGSMYRGGPTLSGAYAEEISAPLALDWQFTSNYFGHNPSSPAVAGNSIYFCAGDRVYALDAATGEMKWRYPEDVPLSTTVHTSPAYADGTVFIGADDGQLYAIDAKSGKEQWKFRTLRNSVSASPTVMDGIVYFGTADGMVWAVDAKAGTPVSSWRSGVKTSDEVTGAPAVASGMVFALSTDQTLHAIGTTTGRERWFYHVTGSVLNMSPVVLGDYVYVANGSSLTSLLSRNGSFRWNKILPADVAVAPAIDENGIYLVTTDNKVMAFDPRVGREKWKAASLPKLDYDVLAPPTIAGHTLLVGTAQGGLYAIDTDTGAVKWTYTVQPSSTSSKAILPSTNAAAAIVVANKTAFVLTDDGTLSAFRSDALDTVGPLISDTEPDPGIVVNGSPPFHFEAKIVDEGSGVDPASVKLSIDGQAVPIKPTGDKYEKKVGFTFDPVTSTLEYTIDESSSAGTVRNLADGRHRVAVMASDWKGNKSTKEWGFTVDNSLAKVARRKPNANGPGGGIGPGGIGGPGGSSGGPRGGGGRPGPGGGGRGGGS